MPETKTRFPTYHGHDKPAQSTPFVPEVTTREVPVVTRTLAFNTIKTKNGLFAAQIIKYEGDKILAIRTGAGTTFGHATNEAGDLLTHYHLYEYQNGPDSFFEKARMI